MADRISTLEAELVRHGANDARRARRFHGLMAAALGLDEEQWQPWEDELGHVCDVEQALSSLADLADAAPETVRGMVADPHQARRLVRVLGGSAELGKYLTAHPDALDVLAAEPEQWSAEQIRTDLLSCVSAIEQDGFLVSQADPVRGADELRLANRRHLLRIAARDLSHDDPTEVLESVSVELADLADGVIESALALARTMTPGHQAARLAVIAMGKCGARELNYISDVDVIHVVAPADEGVDNARAIAVGQRLAATVARICSGHSGAGSIWQVDAALRPEGDAGPLVRTLASMAEYYRTWARNWEFQALLKARPMAGD
ncbi:MAG: bifunctional glutamine-synthetase adenylyltransferase/deadenyltransferase, partial [Cutibacterium granulosum]|nr:bifunctional glutamine-synthetase adenylyltransferase/deadenyltransferase [Cutibacterium granulosum]